jgi:hypothetical protein
MAEQQIAAVVEQSIGQGAGTGGVTTTPPASDPSQAVEVAGSGGNAAPPSNPAREAFSRLAKGETPAAINAALYPKPGDDAKPPQQTQQTPATAKDGPSGAAANSSAQPDGQPAAEAIDEKDLAVLKRAKFDLTTWRHIPPSNRKAIVNSLRTTQGEMDRQFQQGRQAGKPGGVATPQTPNDPDDEGTLAGDQVDPDAGDEHVEQAAPARQAAARPPARSAAAPAVDANQFIAKEDLEALEAIGGPQLAETFKRGLGSAIEQAQAKLLGPLSFLIDHYETQAFNGAVSELAKQPGFGQVTADPKNVEALKGKADLLIRAAGNPKAYGYAEAVQDAAASLFKTNVHQAAQAALLNGRQRSIKGSPDPGTQAAPQTRALTPVERSKQIFQNLRQGMSPEAARSAVDGA